MFQDTHTQIKAILFDLDKTLYVAPTVQAFFDRIGLELSGDEHVHYERAKTTIIHSTRGEKASNSLTLYKCYGVGFGTWHDTVNDRAQELPIQDILENHDVTRLFQELAERLPLYLWSNNTNLVATMILKHLGLLADFSRLYTLTDLLERGMMDDEIGVYLKPSSRRAGEIAHALQLAPANILMVGDRYEVDLQPAEEVGMRVLQVRMPEDLVAQLGSLAQP